MGKFNLLTTLSLNAAGMSTGLKEVTADVEKYANAAKAENTKLQYSFRDVAEMGVGEMRKEMRSLRNISFAGKSKQEIDAINERVGILTDSMMDLRKEQEAYGMEFGAAMAGGLQTASAIAEVAVGAASLFGASKEDAEKYQRVMVQLIGVTQAMGVIENAMQQQQLRTIAIKIRSLFATQAQTTATIQATVAQRGLNLAMLATPTGMVLAGIVALGAGVLALGLNHRNTVPEIDKTSEAYQTLIEKQKELIGLSTDLAKANEDAANKLLVQTGQMTEKEYALQKIASEKKRKLEEVDAKEKEARRAAQVAFEQTAGYMYVDMERDKAKAVEDANKARAEIIKEAYLLEQALNKTAKTTTVDTTTAYEKLNNKISEVNKQIQNYILLGKDASALFSKKTELENQKLAVDLVINQVSLRDSGGLINVEAITSDLEKAVNEAVENIEVDPIKFEMVPIKTDSLIDMRDKANLASGAIGSLSDAFVAMAGDSEVSFKAVVMSILGGVRQIIIAKLAEAIAGQAASNSKFGLPGLIMAGVGITGVMAIFNSLPKFAGGGIVGGSSFSGDMITARVNSSEMILNTAQQAELFDLANGRGAGGAVRFEIEGTRLVGVLANHNKKTNSFR